jgi:hypothetical protein
MADSTPRRNKSHQRARRQNFEQGGHRDHGEDRSVVIGAKYINSVPLAPKALGAGRWRQESVWRSAFSVVGDRGDAGVLGVSWRVLHQEQQRQPEDYQADKERHHCESHYATQTDAGDSEHRKRPEGLDHVRHLFTHGYRHGGSCL